MKKYIKTVGLVELKNVRFLATMPCPGPCKGNPVVYGKTCDTCFDWANISRGSKGYVNMNLTLEELGELLKEANNACQ